MMAHGDPEGWIFQTHSHTNNGLVFLLTIIFYILYLLQTLQEAPQYAEPATLLYDVALNNITLKST